MKFSTLVRHIREGSRSIWRNGWMSFASITSIFISLLILGVFILLALNVNVMADQFEDQVQIRAYLNINVTDDVAADLTKKIGNLDEVSQVTLISKEEGLVILRERMGEDNADWLEGYDNENNPLPITLTIDLFNTRLVDNVAEKIKNINSSYEQPPIDTVKYGQGTVEKIFQITNAVRTGGFIIVLGLSVTAILLISNTIRMTIVARQREISIMKMVGATNAFIRWPFFIEGAMIGVLTSLFTTGVVLYGYHSLIESFKENTLLLFQLLPVSEVWAITSLFMMVLGSFIGIWGSVMSIRKYLKV